MSMPDLGPSTLPDVSEIEITELGVGKLLDWLKVNKASGPDNIPARVLNECAAVITPILQCIFLKSLATGTLTHEFCEANVSPIYKKDRSDPTNYHPVSLTSIVSKLLDYNIHHHVMNHTDRYSLISTNVTVLGNAVPVNSVR